MRPSKWEIWLVDMPYEEGIGSKVRPALVIDPAKNVILVGKMTSAAPRPAYEHEYVINDWKGTGLSKPTTLRLSKLVRLREAAFIKKIGAIKLDDMIQIRWILSEILNENKPQ